MIETLLIATDGSEGALAAERTITLLSPSKTYNLPGLACAYAVIPDDGLRSAFKRAARGIITEVNAFGYAGCAAAYRDGEPWRRELIQYLRGNRDCIACLTSSLPSPPSILSRAGNSKAHSTK